MRPYFKRLQTLRIAKERNTALQNDVTVFENYISVIKEKSKL